MAWLIKLGFGRVPDDVEQERIKARLADQERQVQALDRAIEVIRRQLDAEAGRAG